MPTTVKTYAGASGDDSGFASFTIRDVVTTLAAGSLGQVRVTFKAGAGGLLATANCSIGVATGTLANTTATPVELLFAGAHGFSIASNASITSDFVTLAFTSAASLVVIMDMTAGSLTCVSTAADSMQFHSAAASFNLATTPAGSGSAAQIDAVILIETQAAAGGLPPGSQFFDPPVRRVREIDLRQVDLRTWAVRGGIPLLASTQKPSDLGRNYTDRPQPPPWYRDWSARGSIPLLASTQKPSDLGRNYTDRPSIPLRIDETWIQTPQLVVSAGLPPGASYTDRSLPRPRPDATWIETPQLVVATGLPPGNNYTDRPPPLPRSGQTWIETLQPGLTAAGPLPSYDWQLPPSMVDRAVDLRTWIETPSQPVAAVTLPPGENYTDRPSRVPPPVPSWAQFNPNLSQDELPVGESYTERPQLRLPVGYTWIETPPQPTVTVTLPPGGSYTDKPPPLPRPGQTWIETLQPGLTAAGPLPSYDWQIPPSMVDRAVDLRTWIETPLQPSVTVTLPPGGNFTDRPRPVTWSNTWTFNLQETTLAPTAVLPTGKGYTDRPAPVTWYREWTLNLQQTTLIPTVVLPTGEIYTDRPQPVFWFRDWSVNLQATTLAPVVFPVGEMFTDLPQRGPPPLVPSWGYFNINLSQDELPVGKIYTDRPQPPPWYREWLLNLQQSTLAPPPAVFPPGQVYADRPAPISWFRDWTVNLGEFTPVGPDVLPPGGILTALPPAPAPQFNRSWESPYNVNLFSPTSFGPIPVRVGAVGRRKRERERPVDPWSKTFSRQHWKELQALIQAEADAAVEAERRNDPELAVAADAAREVAEALYLADETPTINQDIVRITASLRAGAAKRAEMEAEALTAYLAELEDESECELLLFS